MLKKESATILVVDDDPSILNLVAEQVSFYGYQAIVAPSGKAALHEAEKQAGIDLLLTDIMMPGMNGVDLARHFISLYPQTRVLFMSGFVCPSMAHYGISDSEYGFVKKPFGTKTLIKKIRNVLNGPVFQPQDYPAS